MRAAKSHSIVLGAWVLAGTVGAAEIDFERDVASALARHCAACHNASELAGGLDLTRAETALKGGDSGQPALVPGRPQESLLLARIRSREMPPAGKGAPPTANELAHLETWIASGAAWPSARVLSALEFTTEVRAGRDWWSLKAPARPPLPGVHQAELVRTPLDAFVIERLEQSDLQLSEEADRATLIRRASLDLLGLPPTPEELAAFVADTSANAYEKLVDRLLASPRYGERWARHWLDVVRFGESNGYETNTARENAWPYRDWVIRALNDDMPFARFVLEQLAGDQVGADAATGFLVGGAHDTVGSPDVELTLAQRMNDLDDMVTTTGQTFLGLTVGCARCHDHKFDPIAQRDYYALQAIFAGVRHGERELSEPDGQARKQRQSELSIRRSAVERKIQALWIRHQPLAQPETASSGQRRASISAAFNVDRFEPIAARFVRFTVLATSQLEPCIDEIEVLSADEEALNLALAATGAKATASSVYAQGRSSLHRLEHAHDGRYGNAFSWISAEHGGGWLQIELPAPATISCVVWARDREGAFRDRLATRYKIEVGMDGATWHTVADSDDREDYDSQAKQATSVELELEGLPQAGAEQIRAWRREVEALRAQIDALAPPKVYGGMFDEPEVTYLLYRGEPLQKRQRVGPGSNAAVTPAMQLAEDAPEAERRVALARWIAHPANPLAARVMVNRLWHYHFGQGLIKTPSDLGFNGGQPSHPELLDWLASEFVAYGGRLKPLHRTIMLSSAYRQSSRANADAAGRDAGARMLWRFPPRRLEAEIIRDAVLWTAGTLDLALGGPGYDVFEPNKNYVKVYTPKTNFGPAEWRRMVYQNKPRMRQDATFGEFDCPDSSQAMARRNTSTTALQALNLLNAPFMIDQSGRFAERLRREVGNDPDGVIQRAFWLAFGRAPNEEERRAARRLVEQEGLIALCRAIYNANEFLYLH